ncbi:MAG: hypothetical protein ACRDHV_01090 [Actinomycetota bacterium]
MRRMTGAAITATAAILLLAAPAGAQEYPPEGATCGVSATVVPAGGSLTVSCAGLLPGSPWTITFESEPQVLATGTAGADGSFSTSVTIPSNASPGAHTLTITGTEADGSPFSISIPITVSGAAVPGLAVTGGNITVGLILLAGLLAAAAAALLVGRRRARVQA